MHVISQPWESQDLWEPSMAPDEWPEARDFYSKEDLEEYTRDVRKLTLAKARPPKPVSIPAEAQQVLFRGGSNVRQEKAEASSTGLNGKLRKDITIIEVSSWG